MHIFVEPVTYAYDANELAIAIYNCHSMNQLIDFYDS